MLYFDNLPPRSPAEVHLTQVGARGLGGSFEQCKQLGELAASTLHAVVEMHGQEITDDFGGAKAFTMAALTCAVEGAAAHQGAAVDIGNDQDMARSDGPTRVASFLQGAGEFVAHGMVFDDIVEDVKVR